MENLENELEFASGVEDLLDAEDLENTVEATVELSESFGTYARVEVPAAFMTKAQLDDLIEALVIARTRM